VIQAAGGILIHLRCQTLVDPTVPLFPVVSRCLVARVVSIAQEKSRKVRSTSKLEATGHIHG
jgi:hypothetical protein